MPHRPFPVELSVLVGALADGVVGATLGLVIGHTWEQRHRRKRRERASAK